MNRKIFTALITFLLLQSAGCVAIYHSVKEKRDRSYSEGVELYNQKKYEEANDRFETVVDIEPDYRDAKKYLKKTGKLLALQKKKIELKADINYDKGIALMKNNRFNDALPLLLLAQNQNPDLVDADEKIDECREKLAPVFDKLLKLAESQYRRKKYIDAYTTAVKAKIYNPSDRKLAFLMGETESRLKENAAKFRDKGKQFYDKRNYNSALTMFRLALRANPWDSETMTMVNNTNSRINLDKNYQKGILLFNTGKYYNAKGMFTLVYNTDPSYKSTEQYLNKINTMLLSQAGDFYNNGVTYYQKGKYEAAINEFNKVLSVNPNHSNAREYRNRAQTKLSLKKSVGGSGTN